MSKTDHSGSCFKCGDTDHQARTCEFPARCMVCAENGKDANHRLGSAQCAADRRRSGTGMPSRNYRGMPPAQNIDTERRFGNTEGSMK